MSVSLRKQEFLILDGIPYVLDIFIHIFKIVSVTLYTHTHTHTHKEQPEVNKEISISFRKGMENIKIIKSIFFFSMMSKSINSSNFHSHILKHLSL